METKYIFVTGGVVSSIGKGIVAASLGRLLKNRALCQLQWVDEKLTPREDELRPLFLYVQCNQNPFFKVFKVPETKGISLNDFDEIIGSFQFGV